MVKQVLTGQHPSTRAYKCPITHYKSIRYGVFYGKLSTAFDINDSNPVPFF